MAITVVQAMWPLGLLFFFLPNLMQLVYTVLGHPSYIDDMDACKLSTVMVMVTCEEYFFF